MVFYPSPYMLTDQNHFKISLTYLYVLLALSTALLSVGFSRKIYLFIQAGDAIFDLLQYYCECMFI